MKSLLITALCLSFLSISLQGREIHVSVNGNDSNEGSFSSPLRTIGMASRRAMPGDTVTVHGGVYREQVTPPRGGNSDNERIVYRSAPGEKAEIRGSEIIKGWKHISKDTWAVVLPGTFFGDFNPYTDLIKGDWFTPTPAGRKYHTGAVYLNGDWLMEAADSAGVMGNSDSNNPLWFATSDSANTTIMAQFFGKDPNIENVEINVRQTIFYPDRPFINFITVSGFTMQHAATNWAPPTAEQMGLIGTHWSRGWIIENNTVQYSKCAGISLGKYGDEYDNRDTESAEGYVGTINRALRSGWNRSTVGSHIVRNNTVAYCEQAGIVGSMGCSFSVIEGNTVHDIHVRKLFTGAEMAGIKFHGAVDVVLKGNHIYRTCLGIWLDWMAQGARITGNILHDNELDLFLEVNHGPVLTDNNIMLSDVSIYMNSSGAAFVHNLIGGRADKISYDSRLTPWLLPHSTFVADLHDNPSGDVKFINNIFTTGADLSQFGMAILPVLFDGNVFTSGTVRPKDGKIRMKFGEISPEAEKDKEKLKYQPASEINSTVRKDFNPGAMVVSEEGNIFLVIETEAEWLEGIPRKIVTAEVLGKVVIPGLPYDNPDGSELKTITDICGSFRNMTDPAPGPFEFTGGGKLKIRLK